jgi:TRAP-type C4-dicarboxylate transport system substrate-binding protein
MVETYEQLQKGIIKGVFAPHETYKSMKFAEVIKYETVNFTVPRGPYVSRAMNLDSWKKLPPDIQKIIEASKDWWFQENAKELDKQEEAGEELAKKAGVQFVQMDPADVAKFDDAYEKDNIKAAQELDKKGFPATKFYNEARRLVKQASAQKK